MGEFDELDVPLQPAASIDSASKSAIPRILFMAKTPN
jgi:hypothetical protein